MPMFNYDCPKCGPQRRIFHAEPNTVVCKICGADLKRRPTGASANVYEVLDNGLQARATVRPADAQRIFKEREVAMDEKYAEHIDDADLELDDPGKPV